MDWKDEFRQKLADAGVKMFQKPSIDELQSKLKELENLKLQSTNPDPQKQFTLKHTFTKVSKMDKGEEKLSPMEYHFNVPWYLKIEKQKNDELAVWLICMRDCQMPWSVQCAFQIQIIHPSGKTISQNKENVFGLDTCLSECNIMKWEEMKKEYLDGDELTVVVNVNINKMTGIYVDACLQPSLSPQKQFTLKNTFTDVSKMVEGEQKKSSMEYHFNLPWVVEIEHKNDNLAVWLYCKRESDIPWFVQCALQIEIVHPSGKTKSKVETKVFGSKNGSVRGWYHFMKWEKMKKKYLDKDQLTVVVNGTINQIIGIP